LTEAKKLYVGSNQLATIALDNSFVTPVDLAGAKLFDLHYSPVSTASGCGGLTLPTENPQTCLNNLRQVSLVTQRGLASSDVESHMTQVKQLGLGSLNSYLSKLKTSTSSTPPLKPYSSLGDNLLNDLRNSDADYAINFGILETIYAQDAKTSTSQVQNTCIALMPYTGTALSDWIVALNSRITPGATRTLCTLVRDMMTNYGINKITSFGLQPNLFRNSAVTGGC